MDRQNTWTVHLKGDEVFTYHRVNKIFPHSYVGSERPHALIVEIAKPDAPTYQGIVTDDSAALVPGLAESEGVVNFNELIPCFCNECGGNRDVRKGRCYEVSAHYALRHEATLVHGTIHAPDDLTVNHPHLPHGWCELEEHGIPMVWEPVNGKLIPTAYWDARYSAERHKVYTPDEAREQMLEHQNYGPWETAKND